MLRGSMRLQIEDIIRHLGLEPHREGGFFAEVYRSSEEMVAGLPRRYAGPRAFGTSIYYLLGPEDISTVHRLASDEIFHFYLGDPVEQLLLLPDGSHRVVEIGPDILAGQLLQSVVPREAWQGARLKPGGRYALLGTTVAPGFDFADFEIADRESLIARWPAAETMIRALTR